MIWNTECSQSGTSVIIFMKQVLSESSLSIALEFHSAESGTDSHCQGKKEKKVTYGIIPDVIHMHIIYPAFSSLLWH